MTRSKAWVGVLLFPLLLLLLLAVSPSKAETNQYGVDCSLTPWLSSCSPDYSDMTEYNISDDGRVQVDLPFGFPMYDTVFTTSWMYSNGVVGFMSPTHSFCCTGTDVAATDWSNYTALPYFSYSIAALWTDLVDTNVDVDGDGVVDTGFYTQSYDTDNDGVDDTMRYFWRSISEYYNNQANNTFDVKIDDTGAIEITHFEIDIRNHAVTVGVFGDVTNSEFEQFKYWQNGSQWSPSTNDPSEVYTFDLSGACTANPLISSTCPGYADAYAELLYNQSCAADPLYDSGCPGYATAYFNQQCEANPLYDSSCSGYAQAYYDQQCSLDPLYDSGCTGYAEAYYDQQCTLDPLYDSGCTGYAEAYYDQQCTLDPLYDSGCTGYEAAYLTQQCNLDTLYDSSCPGYETAYYNQQCSLNALYDSGCPGYAEAYFTQQCTADALYSTECDGYEQAYIDQQCELDPLYSLSCSGYAAAAAEQEVANTDNTLSIEIVDAESFTEISATGDSTVDAILNDNLFDTYSPMDLTSTVSGGFEIVIPDPEPAQETFAATDTTIGADSFTTAGTVADTPQSMETQLEMELELEITMDVEPSTESTPFDEPTTREEPESTEEIQIASVESDSDRDSGEETAPAEETPEEPAEEAADAQGEESSEEPAEESNAEEPAAEEEQSKETDTADKGSEEEKSESKEKASKEDKDSDKPKSKREKLKEAIAKKASQLAENMSQAATLEMQQAAQAQVMALIGFVPGFGDYRAGYPGGVLPDNQFYGAERLPESRRGLRNGLAQQILHEKMVDMQYK